MDAPPPPSSNVGGHGPDASPDQDLVSWADSLADVFEARDPGPVARPSGARDMARFGFRVDDYGVVAGWETDQ